MNIAEATEKALASGVGMRREAWGRNLGSLYPSNTDGGCLCLNAHGYAAFRWQPKAEDLLAEDWVVLDGQNGMLYGARGVIKAEIQAEPMEETPKAKQAKKGGGNG